jgi:hypothetical protein
MSVSGQSGKSEMSDYAKSEGSDFSALSGEDDPDLFEDTLDQGAVDFGRGGGGGGHGGGGHGGHGGGHWGSGGRGRRGWYGGGWGGWGGGYLGYWPWPYGYSYLDDDDLQLNDEDIADLMSLMEAPAQRQAVHHVVVRRPVIVRRRVFW